jgi:protein phosphatase
MYVIRSEVNKRQNNEDSFIVWEIKPNAHENPITILAVADGMGGHAHGEIVSREVLRKISLAIFEQLAIAPALNNLETPPSLNPKKLKKVLLEALEQGNSYVQKMVENNKWGKAGSTLVLVAILNDQAVVINLGDSPLFYYQQSTKKLQQITEDHTVAGVLLRAGMISPEMARYHEGRSRLEFYLGFPNLPKDSPKYHLKLNSGDRLLLCSDGVMGTLSLEEMTEIMSLKDSTLETIADNLLQASKDKGETDNQTLVLWEYSPSKINQEKAIDEDETESKTESEAKISESDIEETTNKSAATSEEEEPKISKKTAEEELPADPEY